MRDYHKLKVWEKAHQVVLALYRATAKFPKAELYGLTMQMRRAAVSIPANIAEGCGRSGDAEFTRYLHFAMGSASELDYHLMLVRDLDLLEADEYQRLSAQLDEVRRMLTSLVRKLTANG